MDNANQAQSGQTHTQQPDTSSDSSATGQQASTVPNSNPYVVNGAVSGVSSSSPQPSIEGSEEGFAHPLPKSVTQAIPVIKASLPSEAELEADDVDLIEKQWVLKAKKIVDSTIGDPYHQSKELNRIRAEYIKKRYNKDIKLSND